MTFGETLRMMLELTGIKQAQLAAHLGYDASYINRWINNGKLPSLKNNSPLLRQIAEYLAKH